MKMMEVGKGAPDRMTVGHRCNDEQNVKNEGGTLSWKRERRAILKEGEGREIKKTKGNSKKPQETFSHIYIK